MYSIDFIRCAVAYRDEGHTFTELKTVFKIPPETYYLWKEKLKITRKKNTSLIMKNPKKSLPNTQKG